MTEPDPRTLDQIRVDLATAVAQAAVFDGWSDAAVTAAAEQNGVDPAVARFAFSDGPMAMVAAWIAHVDTAMARRYTREALSTLSIRARIRELVLSRLDAITGQEEALRRALAIMAMPQNLRQAVRLGWHSADAMWRLAGDAATDYNHYTKRAMLGSIYAATLAVFADDRSEGKTETRAFLDRRIDGVMRFEKAKARLIRPSDDRFSMARFLGRLRYPAT